MTNAPTPAGMAERFEHGGCRVQDIAYTAFMLAKQPNDEDGGPTDWFNDTWPTIKALIAAQPSAGAEPFGWYRNDTPQIVWIGRNYPAHWEEGEGSPLYTRPTPVQPDSGGVVEDCQTQDSVDRVIGRRIAQQMRDRAKKLDRSDKPQMAADLRDEADAIDRLAALAPVAAEGGEKDKLRIAVEALEQTKGRIQTWPIDDHETCMCGSPVSSHGVGDGHSPVSQGDHAVSMLVEEIDQALSALRTEPTGGGEG